MRVGLASDHAGWELKEHLRKYLASKHQVNDLGAYNQEPSDYPDFAAALAHAVQAGRVERGVLICGSGVGASVAANKFKEIRAGLCHDTYSARQGVEHDNINILVLGARVIGTALAEVLVDSFLGAAFSREARHVRRLGKIESFEAETTEPGARNSAQEHSS